MIFSTHGVVRFFSKEKFCHRDFLDYDLFVNHLINLRHKYVSIAEALEGKGDALTIDDSLSGGLEAAILCRNFGHQATLFINPFYIQQNILYWFCILNIFLDSYDYIHINWEGEKYILDDFNSKLKFRIICKNKIAKLETEEARIEAIKDLFSSNIEKDLVIPNHLSVLNINDLLRTKSLGIEIHNHGWTHRQMAEINHSVLDEEILKAKSWFHDILGLNTDYYAVPFGKDLPPDKHNFKSFTQWFLTYNQLNYGKIGPKIYNRAPLIL